MGKRIGKKNREKSKNKNEMVMKFKPVKNK